MGAYRVGAVFFQMFVLTGDVPDMIKKIPELFDERGVWRTSGWTPASRT